MIDEAVIFEVHYSNINRYVNPFAAYLLDEKIANQVVIVYDSFVDEQKIKRVSNAKVKYIYAKEYYRTAKGKSQLQRIFFNYSYRIADLYWTYRFKKLNFKCYQQQHGMYADFLERSLSGYFSTINRKWVYLKHMLFFAFVGQWSVFLYMLNKDFIKSDGINQLIKRKYSDKLSVVQSDYVFVWGDYWKEWFFENHFYNDPSMFGNIGNPDYHKFIVNSTSTHKSDQVCYIAQTFVEDGRMEKKEYKDIIDYLAENFRSQLIVKLHPRSDKSIYERVVNNGGGLTYDFPFSGFYLGHYSSLLALAINRDSKVYLLEVNNEKIPEYFSNSANKVFQNMTEWVQAVKSKDDAESEKDISFYFENKKEHPYKLIAERLKKDAKNGTI